MRILGIDVGTSSIKALELDSAFGRYEIHDYHEKAISKDSSVESAIRDLVKGLPKQPDRIVIGISPFSVTFRNLQLPTRDKKAIQAGIGFELEDELPFTSEEVFYDYSVLAQSKQGTQVHVAITQKKHIQSCLDFWKNSFVEPGIITTETWAYRTILNQAIPLAEQQAPILLIQMGNEKTSLYVHHRGAPALVREIRWGGHDLTMAVAEKYQLKPEQAESYKLDHGLLISADKASEATPEQKEMSEFLSNTLAEFMREVRQIELMTRHSIKESIHRILLSGGASLLPGLSSWIEERIKIPTKPFLALSSSTTSGVTYSDQTDARFALAMSYALCLTGQNKAAVINFRKGPFAKIDQTKQINLKVLTKPLLAVGVVSVCLFLSLIVQSTVYKSRLAAADKNLERSIRTFFGQIASSALRTYMANTSTLKASINKELNKQRELARLFGGNPKSPLDFLNSVSTSVPKDVIVDLLEFQTTVDATANNSDTNTNETAKLTFLVSNPQVAEKLAAIMATRLADVQKGKMEEVKSTDGSDKKWKITFTGRPTEDSYGK